MITFGDYLCNIIQKYNLTISSVASKAKIDRTLLSKAISGSRSLNKVTFKKLLSVLEPTNYETETLTELYASSYFGESNYTRIQHLKKNMIKSHNNAAFNKFSSLLPASVSLLNSHNIHTTKPLNNIYDIKRYIDIILKNEWNLDSPVIYTNYPFDIEYISELLLNCIDTYNKHADLNHVICFSESDSKSDEMTAYINAIRFQQKGYETKFYITGDGTNRNFDIIYPYYIITSNNLILFNKNLESAMFVSNAEFALTYRSKFTEIADNCMPVVRSLSNSINMRELLLPFCSNAHEMLSFSKTLSMFITDETIGFLDYDKNDYSSIIYLQELCDINSHILTDFNFYTLILYKNAITDLINDGKIYGIPSGLNITVPPEKRYVFLNHVLDFMHGQNVSFYITNESADNLSDDIFITVFRSEIYRNNIVFANTLTDTSNSADIRKSCVTTTNDSLVQTYSDFIEYLILFSYTDNPDISIEYLEKQVKYAADISKKA